VYEETVADPEAASRRLVAFCGLDWEAGCLAFHATDRPVRTASLQQVRRPVYGGAVGQWRRYERHLGPLVAALGCR
ncbi:MAG: sulfotransferase family protein, partial [Dongiaceae bacterium]